MSIEKYSPLVVEYIVALQKQKLIARFGIGFENHLSEIFPTSDDFQEYIATDLELEFGDDDDDERFGLEGVLRGEALNEITNVTQFEFAQQKSLLNLTELSFRSFVSTQFTSNLPYNATLYSDEIDAEILKYPDLERPILFFHSGLFLANVKFCKLYVQLIGIKETNSLLSDIPYFIKSQKENGSKVILCAAYFYNRYFSNISQSVPSYSLNTQTEKSLLAIFLESIAFFIYSHEVGHTHFNHSSNDLDKPTEKIWAEEFEADQFAMDRILELYNNKTETMIFTFIGPIIFFKYRYLLEKYKPEIGAKETHPPTMQRLARYYVWLEGVFHSEDKILFSKILDLEQQVSLILKDIFQNIDNTVNKKTPQI
jgi:hypothetical protein